MSQMKKWIKLMESVPPVLADRTDQAQKIQRDSTVMVSPKVGGGVGRFMEYTQGGAMIDIKGVPVELSEEDFSLPERDYQDPYHSGNDWAHATVDHDTPGTMNDKPEFRAGDLVKVADVYGSVIGTGIGVFISYSTTGQECIVSVDDAVISVPTKNVAACLEQIAKDNFSDTDNDGNLSPMSMTSNNVKKGTEDSMENNKRDEFAQWMSKVEEALAEELDISMLPQAGGSQCGCQDWKCPVCFPDDGAVDVAFGDQGSEDGDECPVCGHHGEHELGHDVGAMSLPADINNIDYDEMAMEEVPMDEEDMDFDQGPDRPRSGKGVKLGDIVQKFVKSDKLDNKAGAESPLTYGEDNLKEMSPDEPDWDADPLAVRDYYDTMNSSPKSEQEIEQRLDMVGKILYMQSLGASQSSNVYAEGDFENMSFDQIRKCYQDVTGNSAEMAQQGQPTMENVDKDVQTWMGRFKAYDDLKASKNPMMEKKEVKEETKEVPAFLKKGKKDGADATEKRNDKVGADVFKNPRDGKKDVKEAAAQPDQEVLDWMARFSKLGNMKGYGR